MAAQPSTSGADLVTLRRLLPPGEAAPVAAIVEQLGPWQRPPTQGSRPHVMLNMVSTVDGRATLAGRSGPLSDRADRALFHGLRAAVDAVLVGAGTVRTERYGRIIPDPATRQLRLQRGLSEEPLACIVSGRLALDGDELPLLAEPAAHVVIITPSAASLPTSAAQLDYIRASHEGHLDLDSALRELGERYSVGSILCEGGPHLCSQLLAAGLVDELFLTLAPKLAGGEPAGGEALRILTGAELQPPVELELREVLAGEHSLFLRYGVSARERVSRETIANSSLAK